MTFLISADLSQGRARAPGHQAPASDLSPVPASQAPAADDLAENGAPRLLSGSLSGPSPPPLPLPQCPAETSALCQGILRPLPDQLALPSVQPTRSSSCGPRSCRLHTLLPLPRRINSKPQDGHSGSCRWACRWRSVHGGHGKPHSGRSGSGAPGLLARSWFSQSCGLCCV